jgi:predicted DNA-binding transcriptional regulator YafY
MAHPSLSVCCADHARGNCGHFLSAVSGILGTWPTSSRTLRSLSLLQSRRYWPGMVLAERRGVSSRTRHRDVDRLGELSSPVSAGRGEDGGYQLAPGASPLPWSWTTRIGADFVVHSPRELLDHLRRWAALFARATAVDDEPPAGTDAAAAAGSPPPS